MTARRVGLALVGVAISALAIAVLVASIDIGATMRVLAGAQAAPLLLILPVLTVQLVLRTYRWRALLAAGQDGFPIPIRRLVGPLTIGYLGNAVLPARLGEPTRALLVARRERVGVPESLAVVLLERIVDLATLAVVVFAAAAVGGAPSWVVEIAAIAGLAGGIAVAVLATGTLGPLAASAGRLPLVRRSSRARGFVAIVTRFAVALGGRRRVIVLAAVVSTVAWLLDAATFFLVARSLGVDLAPTSAMLVSGVTVLGTAVPSAPGYVGTYELAASATLTSLGVGHAPALAVAILAHLMTVVPTAAVGAASLLLVQGARRATTHA